MGVPSFPARRLRVLALLVLAAGAVACSGGSGLPPAVTDDGPGPDAPCVRDCRNRQCGSDGCGGTCGECAGDQTCNPRSFQCVGGCVADCTGRQCGSDGCAGSCGQCAGDTECADGRCVAKASCTDGQVNGAETDADCGGGTCPKCLVGKACKGAGDCLSGLCTDGACVPDLTCQDHAIGGDETDVDCGGTKCDPCALTKFCKRHEDCLSLACIFGVCTAPTCSDGARNQGESDIDCGGPCGRCAEGRACNGPGDCATAACEGGSCCVPNACGQCAALPREVCDGADNDCNGQTDEASAIGAGDACPKQQGVCAGAVARCAGAGGWVCDDAAYRARSSGYQAAETLCDGKDNDCDGGTDEGLKNACGTCGAVPLEVCNGADDDCDGSTDEDERCASCLANPTPYNVDSVSSSWGLTMSWAQYAAMLGDEMFLLSYNRGASRGTDLFRCGNGYCGSTFHPGVGAYDVSAITSGGGFLHVAAEDRVQDSGCNGQDCMVYLKLDRDGAVKERSVLGVSLFSGDGHASVAWGGGRAAVMFHDDVGPYLFLSLGNGTWTWGGSPQGWEYGTHAGLRSDGIAFVVSRDDAYNPSTVSVRSLDPEGPGQDWTIDDAAGVPSLRVAPDDTVWVAYARSGVIRLRSLKKGSSTWTAAVDVDLGRDPGLAFDPAGQPVLAYVQDDRNIAIARRSGSAFTTSTPIAAAVTGEVLSMAEPGVDGAGRVHVAFRGSAPGTYDNTDYLHYAMACPGNGGGTCTPACGGRACGDDGCNGSCGTCPDGQSCVDGQCVGGPGCGLDAANTCQGRCGQFTPGASCQCNAACANYGDCCPDLSACCGA